MYKTLEEIAALPVFPELEQTDGGSSFVTGPPSGPGYVYFVTESGGTSYFKVGRTGNPSTRLSNLQTGNPRRLSMNPQNVQNMAEVEARVLKAMREKYSSAGGGTEWFSGNVTQAEKLFLKTVKG